MFACVTKMVFNSNAQQWDARNWIGLTWTTAQTLECYKSSLDSIFFAKLIKTITRTDLGNSTQGLPVVTWCRTPYWKILSTPVALKICEEVTSFSDVNTQRMDLPASRATCINWSFLCQFTINYIYSSLPLYDRVSKVAASESNVDCNSPK